MLRIFILSGRQSVGAILQDAARSSAAVPRKRSHLPLHSSNAFSRKWSLNHQRSIFQIHTWFLDMVSMPISRSLPVSPECSSGLLALPCQSTTHTVSTAITTLVAEATPSFVGLLEISVGLISSVNRSDSPLVNWTSNALLDLWSTLKTLSLVWSQTSSHHSLGVNNLQWTHSSRRITLQTVLQALANLLPKQWEKN